MTIPNVSQAQVSVANTNRDGTGTTVVIWTAGPGGSLLGSIVIIVPGASVADVIRFFWDDGTNKFLFDEVQVTAVPSPGVGTNVARQVYTPPFPVTVPAGWKLRASTNQGQTTNLQAFGTT